MVPILLAVLAAGGFYVATLLVETALGTSRRFHHLSVVVAAGILLGVAFADLIPETLELLDGLQASLAIATGFLALFLVEALTGGHTHHHEPHLHAHGHAHGQASAHSHDPVDSDACVPRHAVLPFLIGVGIHNFADGVLLGASHEVSSAATGGAAVGILVHQLPVGLSFAAVLLASGLAIGRINRYALLIAALIPLGTLLVVLLPDPSDTVLGTLIGLAAGALLYIAAGHLLPEAQSEHRRPVIAAAFTAALVGTVLVVSTMHERTHGDHAGEHADEHAAHEEDEHAEAH